MMNDKSRSAAPGKKVLAGSPDDLLQVVITRLPSRVEYSFVEMILSEVPGPATTELWTDRGIADSPRATRERSTYGALERLLRRRELTARRLKASARRAELERVSQARRSLVDQLLGESAAGNLPRRLSIRQVDPGRRGAPRVPPLVDRPLSSPRYGKFLSDRQSLMPIRACRRRSYARHSAAPGAGPHPARSGLMTANCQPQAVAAGSSPSATARARGGSI